MSRAFTFAVAMALGALIAAPSSGQPLRPKLQSNGPAHSALRAARPSSGQKSGIARDPGSGRVRGLAPFAGRLAKPGGPKVIGLTGGIASGKSTVAQMFRDLGYPVLDADQVSREVMAKGSPVLRRIAKRFGPGVLDGNGELDRAKLGQIVFSDQAQRLELETITHPAIKRASARKIARLGRAGQPVVFYEAALLVEAGWHRDVDQLVVVVTGDRMRVERLMQRNGLSRTEAETRLAAQMPQAKKAALADFVIDNSTSLEATRAQVATTWAAMQHALQIAPPPIAPRK